MQYRTFKKINEKTSLLGMGCMRLPVDSNDTVKEEETIRIIRDAIDGGVNYVVSQRTERKDPGEGSEGRISRKNPSRR